MTPPNKSSTAQRDILVDEDFSGITWGSEEQPDTTSYLASSYYEPGIYIDPSLTKDGTWAGEFAHAAGGAVYLKTPNSMYSAALMTPLGDYSGEITVTLKAKAMPHWQVYGEDPDTGEELWYKSTGSSIGVAVAEDRAKLAFAIEAGFAYDTVLIAEKYLADCREINCAACLIGGKVIVSECEEAFASEGLLSFDDKYSGGGRSVIPADIPKSTEGEVKDIVRRVYTALDMRGIARFDFLLSEEKLYLSEVNTVPGSLAWYLFAKSFKKFCPFLNGVIEQAVSDFKKEREKLLLKTGILAHVPALTSKIK